MSEPAPADRVRVGICSWADPALIESGTFYPRKSMTAEARLRFYARVFDTVEINSSYYAIPAARNAALWVDRTPPGFCFHIKAYSLMTGHHPRAETLPAELQRLLPDRPPRTRRGEVDWAGFPREAYLEAFRLFRAAVLPLAEAGKLGYVLFQLAPWVRYGRPWLEYLASLPERLPGFRIAVEFRNRSWLPEHADATLATLRGARLAHVIVDAPVTVNAVPRLPVATAPVAVFRLHGRNAEGWLRQLRGEEPAVREKYDYLYSEAELLEIRPEVERVAGESEQVFVSFNNNNRDYPVRNALMLKRLLRQPTPGGLERLENLPRDLFA
ncbi:MAG: DUF72 domain-containing protein [Candidatus Rokubacteria bacterium]|nr:DUF72 domain-containing protein [Candidatus Rokubacteria bacterium]